MENNGQATRKLYIVKFLELPFEDIDEFVCVPASWVSFDGMGHRVTVAYPNNESHFDTRDRVKRYEPYDKNWSTYEAEIEYISDNVEHAESLIATRIVCGTWAHVHTVRNDTQPNNTPVTLTKEQLKKNSIKLDEAAKSSCGGDSFMQPRCSKGKQMLMNPCNQWTIVQQRAKPRFTKQNNFTTPSRNLNMQLPVYRPYKQPLNMPIIDIDASAEIHTPSKKHPSETSTSHRRNNMRTELFTTPKPANIAKLNPQANLLDTENSSLNCHLHETDFTSAESTNRDQRSHTIDITNNTPSTYHIPNSLKMSTQLYSRKSNKLPVLFNQNLVIKETCPRFSASNFFNIRSNILHLKNQSKSSPMRPGVKKVHPVNCIDQNCSLSSSVFSSQVNSHSMPNTTLTSNKSSILINERPSNVHQLDGHSNLYIQNITGKPNETQSIDHSFEEFTTGRSTELNSKGVADVPVNIAGSGEMHISDLLTHPSPKTQHPTVCENVYKNYLCTQKRAVDQSSQTNFVKKRVRFSNHIPKAHTTNTSSTVIDRVPEIDRSTANGLSIAGEDSEPFVNRTVISDHEVSINETLDETTADISSNETSTQSNSTDRGTTAESSTVTNKQTHSRTVTEEQMFRQIVNLFIQMSSMLNRICEMYLQLSTKPNF